MENLKLEASEISPNKPTLTFLKGSCSLAEVIRTHPMPVVVKFDCERQPVAFNQFNFDLSQPLLLYRRRNIQKVPARSLAVHAGKYVEVGEPLLIPEDYKGWFAVLQRWMGNSKADTSEPHFTTVEELANSNTDRFLVGGTHPIHGLHVIDRSSSHLNHQQRQFLPGDTLTRIKIYLGETKKKTRLFRKPKYITAKFLMCYDDSDREILLPFELKGIFYQISERSGKPNRNVMQMSDVVARNLHPRVLKLVFGRFPVTPSQFNGLLKAESVMLESSVLAATIQNKKNILLEIPLLAEMFFRVAVLNDDLKHNSCYRNAVNLCSEKVTTYMRNIKVCYNFADHDDIDVNENATPNLRKRQIRDTSGSEQFLDASPFNELLPNIPNKLQPSLSLGISNARLSPLTKRYDKFNRPRSYGLKSYYKLTAHHEVGTGTKPNTKTEDHKHDLSRSPRAKRATILKQTRLSEETATLPIIRPLRSISMSRMSLCLGNSYLTVPIYASDLISPKEEKAEPEGNSSFMENLTTEQGSESQRRLSRISFDGRFFNEEEDTEATPKVTTDVAQGGMVPPPMSRTNIDSYMKLGQTPTIEVTEHSERTTETINNNSAGTDISLQDSHAVITVVTEHSDKHENKATSTNGHTNTENKSYSIEGIVSPFDSFPPVVGTTSSYGNQGEMTDCNLAPRRRSVKPPETAPPPIPSYRDSRTSSGFSSASRSPASSTCDDLLLGRNSAELVAYDVPKGQETATVISDRREPIGDPDSGKPASYRKASTFIFPEGCPEEQKHRDMGVFQEVEEAEDGQQGTAEGGIQATAESGNDATADWGDHDDTPIYENMKALMEFVGNLECAGIETENSEVAKAFTYGDNNTATTCNDRIENKVQAEGNDIISDAFKRDDNRVNIDKEIDDFNKSISDIGFHVLAPNVPPPKPAKPMRVNSKEIHNVHSASVTVSELPPVSGISFTPDHNKSVIRSKSDNTSVKVSDDSYVKPVLRSCSETTSMDNTNPIRHILRSHSEERAMANMSVDQLVDKLKEMGITGRAVQWLQSHQIDGRKMSMVIDGELDLKDCLKGVRLVDQQKISMFIRGWTK